MYPASSCGDVGNSEVFTKGITAALAAQRPAPPSGLVSLATSQTQDRIRVVIQGKRNRLSKMRRVLLAAAGHIQQSMQEGGFRYRVAFITTTYRPDAEWYADQISRLMDCYRKWCSRRNVTIRGVWVLETTKSGRPHYHIALFLPRGITPPKPDKQGWWRHGMTNCTWAQKPVAYLAKYASKGFSRPLPENARLYGIYGVPRIALAYWRAPAWLRENSSPGDDIKRNKEWWVNKTINMAFRSPWILDGFGPDGVIYRWVGWKYDDIKYI